MYYAYMAVVSKRPQVRTQLRELQSRHRITQAQLASRFGITQGHLSKLRRGKIQPGKPLKARIEQAYDGLPDASIEPWLENIRLAAETSRDAKSALEALARIIQKYA